MQLIKITILLICTFLFSTAKISAETEKQTTKTALRQPAEFQKIIDEYKGYLAKIPVEVRDEIIKYRKSIAKLNMQKRNLYRQLSQEGQNYLKKEQDYKQKLPLNRRKLINLKKPITKEDSTKNETKSTNSN